MCTGLRAQDVFAPFFVSFLSVMKEMKIKKLPEIREP